MDPGVLSAMSALAGTSIGAFSSFGTTWLTTKSQADAVRLSHERAKREELYGRFMDELAALYSRSLYKIGVDHEHLTIAYAPSGRIGLFATKPVSDAVIEALRFIVDLELGPCRTQEEIREIMDQPSLNEISLFAQACRDELLSAR